MSSAEITVKPSRDWAETDSEDDEHELQLERERLEQEQYEREQLEAFQSQQNQDDQQKEFTGDDNTDDNDNYRNNEPSRRLDEIPQETLEKANKLINSKPPPYTLFIGSLPARISEDELMAVFDDCKVENLRITRAPETNTVRFAFLDVATSECFINALRKGGTQVKNKSIVVDLAQESSRRQPSSGPGFRRENSSGSAFSSQKSGGFDFGSSKRGSKGSLLNMQQQSGGGGRMRKNESVPSQVGAWGRGGWNSASPQVQASPSMSGSRTNSTRMVDNNGAPGFESPAVLLEGRKKLNLQPRTKPLPVVEILPDGASPRVTAELLAKKMSQAPTVNNASTEGSEHNVQIEHQPTSATNANGEEALGHNEKDGDQPNNNQWTTATKSTSSNLPPASPALNDLGKKPSGLSRGANSSRSMNKINNNSSGNLVVTPGQSYKTSANNKNPNQNRPNFSNMNSNNLAGARSMSGRSGQSVGEKASNSNSGGNGPMRGMKKRQTSRNYNGGSSTNFNRSDSSGNYSGSTSSTSNSFSNKNDGNVTAANIMVDEAVQVGGGEASGGLTGPNTIMISGKTSSTDLKAKESDVKNSSTNAFAALAIEGEEEDEEEEDSE